MELTQVTTTEDLVLKYIFEDPLIQSKVSKDLEADLFKDQINASIVTHTGDFITKYKRFPTAQELYHSLPDESNEKIKLVTILKTNTDGLDKKFAYDKVEEFIRNKRTYNILIDAGQLSFLNKLDEMSPLVKKLQDAVNYKIQTNLGLDAVTDIEEVLHRLKYVNVPIPAASRFIRSITGNAMRAGGFMRKALSLYMGQTNIGKTIHLCNDAAFAYMCGYNVLYVTLELAEEFILQRIYSNVTGIDYNKITGHTADDIRELMKSNFEGGNTKHGKLFVKEMPSTTTPMDLENLLNLIKVTTGIEIDFLCVDYIGKMKPMKRKNVGNFSHNTYTLGTDVAEQLRDIAVLGNIAVLTASQVNRDGYDSTVISLKNTADSVGLNNTADLMIIVAQDADLKASKMFMNIVIKNRFGPKDMNYLSTCDYNHMKIRDTGEEEQRAYLNKVSQKEKEVTGFNSNSIIGLDYVIIKEDVQQKEPDNKNDIKNELKNQLQPQAIQGIELTETQITQIKQKPKIDLDNLFD